MGKSDSDNTLYLIKGHKINGTLGRRLAETAVTGINQLPGVVVPTSRGVFYSELYTFGCSELYPLRNPQLIQREKLTETSQGLIERVTREMAEKGRRLFTVRRSPQYYNHFIKLTYA